jgi:hypothetical protein
MLTGAALITKLNEVTLLFDSVESQLHTLVCGSVIPHSLYGVRAFSSRMVKVWGQYLFRVSDDLDQVKFVAGEC